MKTTATAKNRTKAIEHANVAQEISKGAIATMGGVSGLIGLWAVACFVGGVVNAGGPLAFATSWFQAVIGM